MITPLGDCEADASKVTTREDMTVVGLAVKSAIGNRDGVTQPPSSSPASKPERAIIRLFVMMIELSISVMCHPYVVIRAFLLVD